MDYSGFSPADEARMRRLVEAMPREHTQHIRTVRYGASGRDCLADAGGSTCTIYDAGLARDDVDLSGIIAHENYHCGHGINEHAACAAQADYLASVGHHAHARAAREYASTLEYQEATRRAYGGTLPAGAFDDPVTARSTDAHQPHSDEPSRPMTRRQREQERGAAVWAAVFGGGSPAPQQPAQQHQAAHVEPSAPQPQQAEKKPMTRRQREQERGAAVLRAVFGGKS